MPPRSNDEETIFEIEDYRGLRIIFTKTKWEQKKVDHPELEKATFIARIKEALENPDEVWEDYERKNKNCYYKKYSMNTYAKVVVWITRKKDNPSYVVTAFEINHIKETKYPNLKKLL